MAHQGNNAVSLIIIHVTEIDWNKIADTIKAQCLSRLADVLVRQRQSVRVTRELALKYGPVEAITSRDQATVHRTGCSTMLTQMQPL